MTQKIEVSGMDELLRQMRIHNRLMTAILVQLLSRDGAGGDFVDKIQDSYHREIEQGW